MLKQIACAASIALAAISAPLPLRAPQVGIIRDAAHNLRPVYGFSGNLITGEPLPPRDVLAASFSDQAGIVLTPGAVKLLSIDGEERGAYATTEAEPVLSIAGPAETAIAWLPSENKLVRWTGRAFSEVPVNTSEIPGPVMGLEMRRADSIDLFVKSQSDSVDALRISLKGGAISRVATYADAYGQAVAAGQAVVFSGPGGLHISSDLRPVDPIVLPDSQVKLEKSSSGWIHVSSSDGNRDWMLRVDGVHPVLSELPAVQPLRAVSEAAQ